MPIQTITEALANHFVAKDDEDRIVGVVPFLSISRVDVFHGLERVDYVFTYGGSDAQVTLQNQDGQQVLSDYIKWLEAQRYKVTRHKVIGGEDESNT